MNEIHQEDSTTQQTGAGSEAVVRRIRHPNFPTNCRRLDERLTQQNDVFDDAAANFLEILGDCQLVGARSEVEATRLPGLALNERTKPSAKKQLEVQLALGNIWVRNGPPSFELVTFRFTDRNRAVSFLERNPELARTLILAVGDEIALLAFIKGAGKPLSADLPGLRIQGVGEVLLFDRHNVTAPRYFVQYKRPLTIDLRDLKWDPDHEAALLPAIIEARYGAFSRMSKRGKRLPNSKAWAGYIATVTRIIFSRVDGHFYASDQPAGKWTPLDRPAAERRIEECIRNSPLPQPDKAFAADPDHIAKVIGYLKRLPADEPPVTDQHIRDFITDNLEAVGRPRTNGHHVSPNLTVGELYQLYRVHAEGHQNQVIPLTVFERHIARLMKGPPLYIPKSGSVKRNCKDQNGFRGVRVKQSQP